MGESFGREQGKIKSKGQRGKANTSAIKYEKSWEGTLSKHRQLPGGALPVYGKIEDRGLSTNPPPSLVLPKSRSVIFYVGMWSTTFNYTEFQMSPSQSS